MREQVQSLAKRVHALPTLPSLFYRIDEVTRDPDASAREVAEAVSTDPSLAAGVLRVANSAHYGGTEPVTTISPSRRASSQAANQAPVEFATP